MLDLSGFQVSGFRNKQVSGVRHKQVSGVRFQVSGLRVARTWLRVPGFVFLKSEIRNGIIRQFLNISISLF
jgi:hypothetical protein